VRSSTRCCAVEHSIRILVQPRNRVVSIGAARASRAEVI